MSLKNECSLLRPLLFCVGEFLELPTLATQRMLFALLFHPAFSLVSGVDPREAELIVRYLLCL
jgi:hypothetical protein